MKKNIGGVVNQKLMLLELESVLELGAKDTAEKIGSNYNTYKQWKSGRRNMCGTTLKLIDLFIIIYRKNLQNTLIG